MATKPVFVLVPGGFHHPGYFSPVAELLRKQGHTVLTPALAVAGNDADTLDTELDHLDDIKAIHGQVLPQFEAGGEAILVDHSYGSLPGTGSIEGQTVSERKARGLPGGFRALVRVAGGAIAERGLNMFGQDARIPLPPFDIIHEERGLAEQPREIAADFVWSNLSREAKAANMHHLLRYQTLKSATTRAQYLEKEITSIPKWYVITEQDRGFTTAMQEGCAKTGEFDRVVRLPSDHTPFLSMPERLAEILFDVVNAIESGK